MFPQEGVTKKKLKIFFQPIKVWNLKEGRQRFWNQMKSLWFVIVLGLIKHIGHEAEINSEVLAYPLEVGEDDFPKQIHFSQLSIELARAQD